MVGIGSTIEADGTAANPIVFTSQNDLERRADNDATNDDGGDNISEWGGLVILGRAPINRCRDASTPGTVGASVCTSSSRESAGCRNRKALHGFSFLWEAA